MATRRSTILVEVLNLAQLQQLNRDLSVHNTRLQALTATYLAFNAATTAASAGAGRLASQFVTINNTVNNANRTFNTTTNNIQNMGNAANRAGGQFGGMLGTMLQYRAVSAVFEGVSKSVAAVTQAMYDMERGAARSARVLGPGSAPGTRADIAVEVARTGASIDQVQEALYQLAPFIKETDARFAALKTTMNLVVGTESDPRETARLLIQLYNEFGDQLDKTASKAENLTRIGNMLAIMFTETNTEVPEMVQAVKYLGPVLATLNVPLEKGLALLGALDKAGLRASTAGTGGAAFLSQFVRRYEDNFKGRDYGGVTYKGKEYPFEAVRDATTGGIDPIETIRKVKDATDALRKSGAAGTKQAEMMWAAVGGSERSGRVLGALLSIPGVLDDATRSAAKLTAEHHRTSDAAEKLRVTMTTTAQEFQRAWGGAISVIANMIDTSGIKEMLHGWAEEIQHLLEGMRLAQGVQQGILTRGRDTYAGGSGVRPAVEQTGRALARSLANYQEYNRTRHGPDSDLDYKADPTAIINTLGAGMSTADREMLRGRYFAGRGNRSYREVVAEMERDLATTRRQLADPNFGRAPGGALGPANPFGPGLATRPGGGLPGFGKPPIVGDTLEAIEQRAKEAKSKADKEERERLQAAQKMADAAHIQYQKALKDWGPEDPRTKNEAKMSDLLAKMAADSNEQLRLRYGLTGDVKENEEAIVEAREKQLKLSQDELKLRAQMTEYYARDAAERYGGTSQFAYDKAKEAQAAAIAAARIGAAKGDHDQVTMLDLQAGRIGPLKVFADAVRENAEKKAQADQDYRERRDAGVESLRAAQQAQGDFANQFAEDLAAPGLRRMRALRRGLRPNLPGGMEGREEGVLTAEVAEAQKALALIQKHVPDAAEKIEEMKERLADANAALTDFHDTLAAKARDRQIQSQEDAYDYSARQIGRRHGIRFLRDEQSEFADQMQQLTETLALEQQRLQDAGLFALDQDDTRYRDAQKRVQEARERLADAPTEYGNRRYAEEYYRVQGAVRGSLMDFFHGQGDLGTVAQNIGGTIVDAALEAQIKKFSDPLVQAVTGEILALQGNTEALKALYLSLTGGGGGGIGYSGAGTGGGGITGAIAAGVVMGIEEGTGGGPVKDAGAVPREPGLGKFGRYASQGLAAYSVFAQGQQQGSNLGSVLGAALAGGAIGGPLGAVVGAGLNLLGGLFKQKSKPTEQPRDLNPAYYNAPSNFDVAAYNYSAYGKLPRMQDVGFDVKPANTPTVIVYVDGARVAAKQEISRQTLLATVSLSSQNMDRHAPN